MVTVNISETSNSTGEQIISPTDSTDKTPYLDQETWHSVARVFTDQVDFPTYQYTNKVKASYISTSKRRSTCSVKINDKALIQVSDYEGQYGISINENIDGYDFLLVLSEDAEAGIPTSGSYSDDKIVLFSGYNRSSYSIESDEVIVSTEYVGIEELLNEIKIDGILEVNHTHSVSSNLSGSISTSQVKYYPSKAIFNQNSMRDMYIGGLVRDVQIEDNAGSLVATDQTEISVFDKTGLQETRFWTCKEILDYIIGVYVDKSPDIRIMLDQWSRIEFVSKFIRFDYGSLANSDLDKIAPMDFDLTGYGLLEAIYKIIDESRLYSVSKKYDSDGVAIIGLRANSKVQRLLDNSGDIPLKIPLGEADAKAKKEDIHESGNLNLNREAKSIGKVIVRSGHLWINTIVTTWGPNVQDPIDSSSKESKSLAANSGFSSHAHLVCTDYNEDKTGVPAQTYQILTSAFADKFLGSDVGMTLADFNEDGNDELFNTEKIATIKPFLFLPYGNSAGRSSEDMVVYTAIPFNKDDESNCFITLSGGDKFHFIQPIVGGKDDDYKLAIKYKSTGFGSFIVYSNADKNDPERAEHRFKEYIDSSLVPAAYKYPANRGVETNEIPLYIRCSIKTDYILKGSAELAGYDPAIHRIHYVDDNQVEFAIQYKDKTYNNAGGWNELTDGWLSDGVAEKSALASLQNKAEALLSKFSLVANSGYSKINGCQHIMVGDMIDEFTGTGRSFDFNAVINKVGLDLETKETLINYGVNHG